MKNLIQTFQAILAMVLFGLLASCNNTDLDQIYSEHVRQAQLNAIPDTLANSTGERETVADIIANSTLIFSDEFDGAEIDESKWNTRYNWGPDILLIDEQQYYVDTQNFPDFGYNPFQFDGEVLSITAQPTPEDLLGVAKNQPYLSGVLTTSGKFDFAYGYVEIRARMPRGAGLWPSFFMLGAQNVDLKPQLFIAESRGGEPQSIYHRYNHADADGEVFASDRINSTGSDFTVDFHTFGVSWSPNKLSFFIDGDHRHTLTSSNVAAQNMYLLLNFAIGGAFAGVPDDNTEFPASFDLDYVRVYHRDN